MYDDTIDQFYATRDHTKTKTLGKIPYSGKGVRLKTKMMTHWKNKPNFPQDTTKRHKKIPRWHWIKMKKEKTPQTKKVKLTIPQSLRKQNKWKHPREEKDTYDHLLGQD